MSAMPDARQNQLTGDSAHGVWYAPQWSRRYIQQLSVAPQGRSAGELAELARSHWRGESGLQRPSWAVVRLGSSPVRVVFWTGGFTRENCITPGCIIREQPVDRLQYSA